MFIRIGFEITLTCASPATILLALLPHPAHGGQVIGEDRLRTTPDAPLEDNHDAFDNRRIRLIAPIGRLTLKESIACLKLAL